MSPHSLTQLQQKKKQDHDARIVSHTHNIDMQSPKEVPNGHQCSSVSGELYNNLKVRQLFASYGYKC